MATTAPEVTFCLPVFNSEASVERCLRAILSQPVPSREILVVDNCSTDNTVARARAALLGVSEARVVLNDTNLGRIGNWNRCLELAAGRYLKFIMVNDVLLPGSTETLLRAARANPQATMICSLQRDVQIMPAVMDAVPENPPAKTYDPHQALRRLARECNDTGSCGGLLLRAEVIRRDGVRFRTDIPFMSDFLFAIELADRGPVVYLDMESYLFDRSPNGRFAATGAKNYYAEAVVCAKALGERLTKYGDKSWRGFEFLWRQYTGQMWNNGMPPLGLSKTSALFKGAGPYRWQACGYSLSSRVRAKYWRLKYLIKLAASKVGLYSHP